MGERPLRRWIALTAVLIGTTGALAPVAAATPVDPVAGAVATAPADTPPADAPLVDPVPADPALADVAPAEPAPGAPAPAAPAPGEPAATDPAPPAPAEAWAALDAALPAAAPGSSLTAATAATGATAEAAEAAPSPACDAMTADVHQSVNPRSLASLVSPFPGEIRKAERYGFTESHGVVFRAATAPGRGLVPVYRMYQPQTGDFLWIVSEQGRDRAIQVYGYRLEQIDFYASLEPATCAIPVYRYLKGDRHRLAASEADRRALMADGWLDEGVKFWAAVPSSEPGTDPDPGDDDDTDFTLAVLPDTQYEVFGDDRFAQRNRWLVRHRDSLDLEFVLHTGDVVSWDTPDHDQYERASAAMRVLDDAGVPSTVTIGNHDTAAVAVGGSAVPGGNTKKLVRDTRTFNRYFSTSRYSPEGVFERGKIDNHFQLFSAGGEDWMILTLELWPRHEVVTWAREVVAEHPDRNVIVSTHSYLRSDGSIFPRHDYGATSPVYLFNKLISQYPNIRMVFSGHVGDASHRVDVGVHGNKIASFMGTFHSLTTNPVQLVEIDTDAGTVDTRFLAPLNGATWPRYSERVTGMDFS